MMNTFFKALRTKESRRELFDNVLFKLCRKQSFSSFKYELSIVAIVKNEGPYIREWLDFHLHAGVEHFFIYDNRSSDNTLIILREFKKRGLVSIIPFPGKNVQAKAYTHAVKHFWKKSRFMAFIDADEFLFPLDKNSSIVRVLKDFENTNDAFGGLVVPWTLYGTSGYKTRQAGGIVETYTMRKKEMGILVKTIAKPNLVRRFTNPHFAEYCRGFAGFDENSVLLPRGHYQNSPPESRLIRLNHYWSKSEEEWIEREKKGKIDSSSADIHWDEFYKRNKNDLIDRAACNYLESVIAKP